MIFSVTILGSNSAIPANGRHPTAQVVNIRNQLFLIDCGEGTQMQMSQFRIKRTKINQIFISHFHGDHVFGLPGLLTSYSLMGRKEPLEIFAPKGLQTMMDVILETSGSHLSYDLIINELDAAVHAKVFENDVVRVYSIPLQHRIPTCGYLFKEKRPLSNIRPEKIGELNIPFSKINDIKNGADFMTASGKVIPNELITFPPKQERSYAYCSDTSYYEKVIPQIKNANLLYHEATFMEHKATIAKERGHATAKEAATIATKAQVDNLLLGHFSSRYIDLNPLLEEAKSVFPNSAIAVEGQIFDVPFGK